MDGFGPGDEKLMEDDEKSGLGDEKWGVSICVYILYVQLQEYS